MEQAPGKTAYLISCCDHYEERLRYFDRALGSLGYDTVYVTSDFSHTTKRRYRCAVPGCVQLPVPAYASNISLARIWSHLVFARRVRRWLEALPQPPGALLCLLPPNLLAFTLARYHRRHPETTLLYDVFDMWPETFPVLWARRALALPFRLWAALRDRNLGEAAGVTTECELFRRQLGLPETASRTIYFAVPPCGETALPPLPRDRAELAYLGAINNIIDIPTIAALLRALTGRLPVRLHIIGDGEKRAQLCAAAQAAGAQVEFYGAVYDETEKRRILSRCHFGLNIMKSAVCIGLTMKSVDYLCHGLPLLNSIPADTAQLIQSRGVGVNVGAPEDTALLVERAIRAGTEPLRQAALAAYEELFSAQRCQDACREELEKRLPTV